MFELALLYDLVVTGKFRSMPQADKDFGTLINTVSFSTNTLVEMYQDSLYGITATYKALENI